MKIVIKNGACTETWFSPRRYREESDKLISFYIIKSTNNGIVKRCHRKNGPAYINKNLSIEWASHHYISRIDGPAHFLKGRNDFFFKGKQCSESSYWNK